MEPASVAYIVAEWLECLLIDVLGVQSMIGTANRPPAFQVNGTSSNPECWDVAGLLGQLAHPARNVKCF